jgi:hypothetical protein
MFNNLRTLHILNFAVLLYYYAFFFFFFFFKIRQLLKIRVQLFNWEAPSRKLVELNVKVSTGWGAYFMEIPPKLIHLTTFSVGMFC